MTGVDDAPVRVLPRELTAISDEVRAVPAPPTPALTEPYGLRTADAQADAQMVSEWMSRPHVALAWEYSWPPSQWRRHLQAQLDGQYSRPYIASIGGTEFMYLELYRAAKDSIATRYTADPWDIGLHAAIAETEYLNRRIASTLLPRVVTDVLAIEPGCRRIMFDPDHRNTHARSVCEDAGAVLLGEHDMTNRRMALYALPRTPSDLPGVGMPS